MQPAAVVAADKLPSIALAECPQSFTDGFVCQNCPSPASETNDGKGATR
ncbi:hypothetical protein [Microbulbifer discodermiae]